MKTNGLHAFISWKFIPLLIGILLLSCLRSGDHLKFETTNTENSATIVGIPSGLTTSAERVNYRVEHFWDNFDFDNPAHIRQSTATIMEKYFETLVYAEKETAVRSLKTVLAMSRVNEEVYGHFARLFKQYLYDSDSRFKNEELYLPILENIMASPLLNNLYREDASEMLETILKNKVGKRAANFEFRPVSGGKGTLYDIQGEYTILFFCNPEYLACKDVMDIIKSAPVTVSSIQDGLLKVLAVFPDEKIHVWESFCSDLPSSWINACDKDQCIRRTNLYNLKTFPSLYLLDKNKHILLKDADIITIISYLQNTIYPLTNNKTLQST